MVSHQDVSGRSRGSPGQPGGLRERGRDLDEGRRVTVSLRGEKDQDPPSPGPGAWGGWRGVGGPVREPGSKGNRKRKECSHPRAKVEGRLLTIEQRFQRALGRLWNEGCHGSRLWRS